LSVVTSKATNGERFGLVDTPEGAGEEYNNRQEGLSIELYHLQRP